MDDDSDLWRQIVETAGDAIVVVDDSGIIECWNSSAERILGFPASETVGHTLDLIIPEHLRERHWEGFREVMKTGVTKYGESLLAVPALHRDSSRRSLEFTIGILRDGDRVRGAAAIMRDVGARLQSERTMRQRLRELQQVGGEARD